MEKILNDKECTCCSACLNICPKNAIKMIESKEGFKYPNIEKDLCVNCGMCKKICPVLNGTKFNNDNFTEPEVYAAWNNNQNIRLDSTSGGVFSELASYIYDNGGVVCGAIYNKEWKVEHFVSTSKDDLDNLRSSKYLQSEINFVYKEIKDYLIKGKEVLFVGSPCQVSGLINFLQKKYDNLYLVDFICRGMNSPKIFKMYLNMLEKKYKSKIIKVKFKNKTKGWHKFCTKIEFENGKSYLGSRFFDSYMVGYLEYNAFMRYSCYNCKFKDMPRKSDLTLADFWGIEKINPKLDNDMGTSMVLVNSLKGKNLLNKISQSLAIEKINSDKSFISNTCLTESAKITESRKNVFENIDKYDYEELEKMFFKTPGFLKRIIIKFKYNNLVQKIYFKVRKRG